MPRIRTLDLLEAGPSLMQVSRVAKQIHRNVSAPLIHDSILDNFLVGGRPRFEKNAPMTSFMKRHMGLTTRPLWGTGKLFQKAILDPVIEADDHVVVIRPRRAGKMGAYLNILHDGGTTHPTVTEKSKRFFWAMHFAAKGRGESGMASMFRGMALKPVGSKLNVRIPARPWTELTPGQLRMVHAETQEAWAKVIDNFARTGKFVFVR